MALSRTVELKHPGKWTLDLMKNGFRLWKHIRAHRYCMTILARGIANRRRRITCIDVVSTPCSTDCQAPPARGRKLGLALVSCAREFGVVRVWERLDASILAFKYAILSCNVLLQLIYWRAYCNRRVKLQQIQVEVVTIALRYRCRCLSTWSTFEFF